MALNLDKALGIHEQALRLRAQRADILAMNLANADTPNFKARDLDFAAALKQATTVAASPSMRTTNAGHMEIDDAGAVEGMLLYRVPQQPALDGNTVEAQVEQAAFARNAVEYQVSLRFLDGKLRGLMTAIKGE